MMTDLYNNLDYKPIIDWLNEGIIYSSSWVLLPIIGKQKFIAFISKKLETIKSAIEDGKMIISAISVRSRSNSQQYYTLLKHTLKDQKHKTLIKTTVNAFGEICKIELVPYDGELIQEPP